MVSNDFKRARLAASDTRMRGEPSGAIVIDVGDGVGDGDGEGVGDGVGLGVGLGDGDGVGVGVGVGVGDSDGPDVTGDVGGSEVPPPPQLVKNSERPRMPTVRQRALPRKTHVNPNESIIKYPSIRLKPHAP